MDTLPASSLERGCASPAGALSRTCRIRVPHWGGEPGSHMYLFHVPISPSLWMASSVVHRGGLECQHLSQVFEPEQLRLE